MLRQMAGVNQNFGIKYCSFAIVLLSLVMGCATDRFGDGRIAVTHPGALVIDHTCTRIEEIPDYWIDKAKETFVISYGHTSHGSQIASGMRALMAADPRYAFDGYGRAGALRLHEQDLNGDLGNPDRKTWAERTRDFLDHGWGDTNVVIWSWCGQVSNASPEDIQTYLNLMDRLEKDYPDVIFIYMTGHLDGSGVTGNLHLRNEQIRAFCRRNGKVLFDFADIERYDPDGNDFLGLSADDGCNYRVGEQRRNWAAAWCDANPGRCGDYGCAHSHPLNCDLKSRAFWWMMASLAGWARF